MTLRLENKIAIITGASGGIGRAVALSYLSEGAKVLLTDKEKNQDSLFQEYFENGRAINILGDISDRKVINEIVSKTIDQFDKVDILFNCGYKSLQIINSGIVLEEL